VPDEIRGRVMGLYTLVFFGTMPLGALLVGAMAERIGEPAAVLANAVVLALVATVLWFRAPFVRHST
jgi:cyanate permease